MHELKNQLSEKEKECIEIEKKTEKLLTNLRETKMTILQGEKRNATFDVTLNEDRWNDDDDDDDEHSDIESHHGENKTKACRFHNNTGRCKKGEQCKFSHKKICRFYIQGRCNKPRCQYLHADNEVCRTNSKNKYCKHRKKCHFLHAFDNDKLQKRMQEEGNGNSNGNDEENKLKTEN